MSLKQLRRLRWAVRGVLTLGVAASVTANVLHAQPNAVSAVIAAWPPLALLLTIDLVSRVPVHRRWRAIIRRGGTTAIASIAAWVSYWHMAGVAARYGERDASPYLLPLSVDGLVIVASVSLVEIAGRIRDLMEKRAPEPIAEQPEPVADDMTSDPTPKPAPGANPNHPTALKIRKLRARYPDLKQEEIAPKARVRLRTVARYWPVTAPDPEPVNGRVPDLEGVPS
jgi:hypothetical protein